MSLTAFLVYGLHWIFVITALSFSWNRSRNFLHPHFMFTMMICVFLSDFLIRGYDDKNWTDITLENIYTYQLIILTIFTLTLFLSSLIRVPRLEFGIRYAAQDMRISKKTLQLIMAMAWGLLLFEAYKRFSSVGWSLEEVMRQSMLPRGLSDWAQASYQGNFIFTIARILLPFSGIAFSYLVPNTKGSMRLYSLLGLMIVLAILVTNGSRTPVVMNLGTLWLFIIMRTSSFKIKVLFTAAAAGAVAALTSLMYLFRSSGYIDDPFKYTERGYKLKYHQDDSYYRAIFAYDYSDYSGQFWDGLFFVYAIITNPIPRALWPGKPLLIKEFYGEFKLWYTTNLYLGEIVAMVGVNWSIIVGIFMGLILYYVLYRASALLRYPMGLAAYLLVGLYIYMCMRSMQNIAIFSYLPAFGAIAVLLMARLQSRHRMPPPGGGTRPPGRR